MFENPRKGSFLLLRVKQGSLWRGFEAQTVLPDRSFLIEQILVENAQIEKFSNNVQYKLNVFFTLIFHRHLYIKTKQAT